MSRLPRFAAYRHIGTRDTMRFYDCDDEEQFDELSTRVNEDDLLGANLLQTFAPDTPTEALNRSFKPVG